jgi:rubrerythrin
MGSVTAEHAVQMAIESQAAAARFYRFLAERTDDSKNRAFLNAMSDLQRHQGQDLKAIDGVFAGRISLADPNSRGSVHTPAPAWVCAEDEGVREAMNRATEIGRQASMFFDSVADQFSPPASDYVRMMARSKQCFADMVESAMSEMVFRSQHSFSFREAMRNAVQAEHACAWVYRGLITRTRDPRARSFLEGMVRFAEEHANEIERLGATVGDARPIRATGRITIVKTVPVFRHPDRIDLNDALGIAHDSEIRAANYYSALAGQFAGKAAQVFLQLAKVEHQHGLAIEEAKHRVAA